MLLGDLGGLGVAVGQRQHKQFAGDELVTALDGFLFRGLHQLAQLGADGDLVVALDLGQLLDGVFHGRGHGRHIRAGALQQGLGAVVLAQHGGQQVQGVDVGVVVTQGQGLGVGQGFLEFGGELVDAHGWLPSTANQ